ncbi:DUF1127 domain-containing protein [Ferrovibrio sp.]|uniref:DUF1127 domain-containing protein n=1 Tax=Ferrovibrio sp. TaxID=1917215 RepID=UPI0031203FCB
MSSSTIMITRTPSGALLPPRSLAARLRQAVAAFAADLLAAQRLGRERDQLAELSDAALKDVGLTRADVWAERRKPLWRR